MIVVVDDQRATEGTLKVMRATRRWLRANGTRYPRAFATTPLCCPSRASIFTGRYAHNHGIFTNEGKPHFDQDHTIQAYLRGAGYRTALVGKYFNDWPLRQRPPHFDRWTMFDGGYHNRRYNVQGEMQFVSTYSTRYLGRRTTHYLEAFERRDGEPWFTYLAPYAPHYPFIPDDVDVGSKVPPWDGNPAVFEKDRSDKPDYVLLRNETFEEWRKNRRKQLRILKSVDRMMKRIRTKLRRLDESSRTLVVYMSDNGYMWADHGLFDKGAPYTPSMQIPMMMRRPGQWEEVVDRRLVGNIDVAATVLDAAGISPPADEPMDGRSLLDRSWGRDRILGEYRNHDNPWTPPSWASIRAKSFQYTEYYDQEGDLIFREYYNLRKDPWELRNILHDGRAGNDPSSARLATLSARLELDRKCAGATCP